MRVATTKNIIAYLESKQSEMLEFLEQLVLIETPTTDFEAQEPLLNLLKNQFDLLNYSFIKMPGKQSGGFLFARPKNRKKFWPVQLLIGHCDTVWPIDTLDSMPLSYENGKIKGPGIYDMKAGLTQIIFALKTIQALDLEPPFTPIILINSDEEKGSRESTNAIRRLAKIATRAFVMEPPLGLDGKLKTARKGLGRFTLTVIGKPAHAGLEPGKGVSAILELSYQIQQLFALNDASKGISVNVGMIEGGVRPNVVAPSSKAVVDVRVLTEEDGEIITKKIQGLKAQNPEVELTIEGGIGRPPMEKTKRNHQLWLTAKKTGKIIGLELQEGTAGGGSDGNTTSLFTATLDGLGTVGDGAHAHHEFIFSEKLIERTVLLTHLLLNK